jgi:hypothetical protein
MICGASCWVSHEAFSLEHQFPARVQAGDAPITLLHPARVRCASVPRLSADLLQGASLLCRKQKQLYSFIYCGASLIGRIARTHDIEGHGMGNELVILFPDLHCVFDIH